MPHRDLNEIQIPEIMIGCLLKLDLSIQPLTLKMPRLTVHGLSTLKLLFLLTV